MGDSPGSPYAAWLDGERARRQETLTFPEIRRALQALSEDYTSRRGRLARGAAFSGEGKRAAYALYYAPTHFVLTRAVLDSLGGTGAALREIVDLGCGTGACAAAWGLACAPPAPALLGIDRDARMLEDARRGWRELGLRGTTRRAGAGAGRLPGRGSGVLAGWSVNELPPEARERLLDGILDAAGRGALILVLEPVARGPSAAWWRAWERAFLPEGGRVDEWRFPASLLPPETMALGRAAGLDPRYLTARSLALGFPAGITGRPPK